MLTRQLLPGLALGSGGSGLRCGYMGCPFIALEASHSLMGAGANGKNLLEGVETGFG